MAFKFLSSVSLVLLVSSSYALAATVPAAEESAAPGGAVPAAADDCLQKDSISCLQKQTYRSLKSIFNQDSIDLFSGLSLVRNGERGARAVEPSDAEMAHTSDVEKRENILEEFTVSKLSNFLQERSIRFNLAPLVNEVTRTARSIAENIPDDVKQNLAGLDDASEARGKKKKLMKQLGPLLMALKMKFAAFAAIAYIVIAVIAKKALLASLLSLLISGFIAIKKLLSHQHSSHEVVEAHPHHGGWSGGSGYSSGGGWESYGGGGSGHDIHGSYSNNVAHTLAYNGQKASRRR